MKVPHELPQVSCSAVNLSFQIHLSLYVSIHYEAQTKLNKPPHLNNMSRHCMENTTASIKLNGSYTVFYIQQNVIKVI